MSVSQTTRTLVTGGAGFLGSHLCRRLLDDGHEVVCVDNYVTGSADNIEPLLQHSRFERIRHDVTQPLRHIRVDQIYNLASPASPTAYAEDPIGTWKTNVLGAMHMLDLAEKCQARIVQASTSEVYGDPEVHPQHEYYNGSVDTFDLRACYNESKRAAETLFADYARERKADARVARLFNTYGPGMALDDGRVVSNFIVQALLDKPLTIYGSGHQTRSFCYVDDMVDGLVQLMDCSNIGLCPINLGNPYEHHSISALAAMVWDAVGYLMARSTPLKSKRDGTPFVYGKEPGRRQPVIDRAADVLAWVPCVPLIRGLRRTVLDFAPRLGVDLVLTS